MCRRIAAGVALATVAVAAGACRRDEPPPAKAAPQIMWRTLGSWSGRGDSQTGSFTSDTGALRVRWRATALSGASDGGRFHLTAHSAISGRVLEDVVEVRGAGSGVGYVGQDPHVFYMAVESSGVAWTFTVDEGVAGDAVGAPPR